MPTKDDSYKYLTGYFKKVKTTQDSLETALESIKGNSEDDIKVLEKIGKQAKKVVEASAVTYVRALMRLARRQGEASQLDAARRSLETAEQVVKTFEIAVIDAETAAELAVLLDMNRAVMAMNDQQFGLAQHYLEQAKKKLGAVKDKDTKDEQQAWIQRNTTVIAGTALGDYQKIVGQDADANHWESLEDGMEKFMQLSNNVESYMRIGQLGKAEARRQKLKELAEKLKVPFKTQLVNYTRYQKAEIEYRKGNLDEAKAILDAIALTDLRPDHQTYATALQGHIQLDKGNKPDALKYYTAARSLLKDYKVDDPELLDTLDTLLKQLKSEIKVSKA